MSARDQFDQAFRKRLCVEEVMKLFILWLEWLWRLNAKNSCSVHLLHSALAWDRVSVKSVFCVLIQQTWPTQREQEIFQFSQLYIPSVRPTASNY